MEAAYNIGHIFPGIFPSLITLFMTFYLILITIREDFEEEESRFFTILTVLVFIYSIITVSTAILPVNNFSLFFTKLKHISTIFLIPVCISIARRTLFRERIIIAKCTSNLLAIIISAMILIDPGHSPILQQLSFMYTTTFLVYIFFFFLRSYTTVAKRGLAVPTTTVIAGICLILILSGLTNILPIKVRLFDFSFIPIAIIAFGFVRKSGYRKKSSVYRQGLIGRLFIVFALMPFTCNAIYLYTHRQFLPNDWLFLLLTPFGIFLIISLMIVMSIGIACFSRAAKETQTLLYSLICIVFGVVNQQELMLLVFPDYVEFSRQISILNHLFIVNLVGISEHLCYHVSGKKYAKEIYYFYGVTALLVILTFSSYYTKDSFLYIPFSDFIRGGWTLFFVVAFLVVNLMGIRRLFKTKQQSVQKDDKIRFLLFISGIILNACLVTASLPAMFGFGAPLFYPLAIIPIIIIGAGIFYDDIIKADAYTQRLLMAKALKLSLLFIYSLLAIGVFLVLKDYTVSHIIKGIFPFGVPAALSFIVALILSIFVFSLEQKRTETLLFSLICFIYTILYLDIFLECIITDPSLLISLSRCSNFIMALMSLPTYLHLVFLVAGKKNNWWVVKAAYIYGIVIAPFTQSDLYITGTTKFFWGYFSQAGPMFNLVGPVIFIAIFYSIGILLNAYRTKENQQQKLTIKFLIVGLLTSAMLTALSSLPMYGYNFYPPGNFVFISLLFLAWGLFRNNIKMLLQYIRSAILWFFLVIMVVFMSLMPYLFMPDKYSYSGIIAGVLALGFFFDPIQRKINAYMNLFIRSLREDMKLKFLMFTKNLSLVHHRDNISEVVAKWIFSAHKSSSSIIYYRNKNDDFEGVIHRNTKSSMGLFSRPLAGTAVDIAESIDMDHPLIEVSMQGHKIITEEIFIKWANQTKRNTDLLREWPANVDLIVPVFFKNRLVALFLAGSKVDGAIFSLDELNVIMDLGSVLDTHIANAELLEGLEETVEKRTQALNTTLVDALEKEKRISINHKIIIKHNHIFFSLFKTTTQINKINEIDALMSYTLDELTTLYPDYGFGIIIEGDQLDMIETASFRGFDDNEAGAALSARHEIREGDVNQIMKEKLGADFDANSRYTFFPMIVRGSKVIGEILIKGDKLEEESDEIIKIFLGQFSSVVYNRMLLRQLEKMANTDGLTEIFNRSYLNRRLEKAMESAERFPEFCFSVIMVDVNGLKPVNDNYGHDKGDEMIIKCAKLLKSVSRASDIVSRLGGDEFAVLLPSSTNEQTEGFVNRVREKETRLTIELEQEDGTLEDVPIRMSFGFASSEEVRPEEVMKTADARMYADKEAFYATREKYR